MSATIINLQTGDKDAIAVSRLYVKAKGFTVDAVNCLIEAGHKLTEKKKTLKHGEWLPWLKENASILGFGEWTAQRLMQAGAKYVAGHVFTETEALQISRKMWGHDKPKRTGGSTKSSSSTKKSVSKPRARGATADKYQKARERVRESIVAERTLNTKAVATELDVSVDTVERAALAEQARVEVLEELSVDPDTLAPSAKAKLEVAKRMMERKLKIEHAARMSALDEEVRQRVLADGKKYLDRLNAMEEKAAKTVALYQEFINNRQPIFTEEQFKMIMKCLQPGMTPEEKTKNESCRIFLEKRFQLTGKK